MALTTSCTSIEAWEPMMWQPRISLVSLWTMTLAKPSQSLALEVAGRGVRVNAVCPGILDTAMWSAHLASEERGGAAAYQGAVDAMIPLGREQTPEDIGAAVIYLATAPNVTGIALNVAGGMEVW